MSSNDQPSLPEPVAEVPTVIKGALLMSKQLLVATAIAAVMTVTIPAVVHASSDETDAGFRGKITGIWDRTKENTTNLKDGLFNNDVRLQRAQDQIASQQLIITELQEEIKNIRIQTDVRHLSITRCAGQVHEYLQAINNQ